MGEFSIAQNNYGKTPDESPTYSRSQIKIGLNILVKGPTWTIKTRLLTTKLQHLNKDGDHCLLLIDHINHRYEEIRNQLHGIFEIGTESSLFITNPFKNSLDLSLQNIITKVFQFVIGVCLNRTGSSLTNLDIREWNVNNRPQAKLPKLLQLDQLSRNVIDFISMIKFHFQLQYHTPLAIINEHIKTTYDLCMNASEEVFVISLMTEQLRYLYDKVCFFFESMLLVSGSDG